MTLLQTKVRMKWHQLRRMARFLKGPYESMAEMKKLFESRFSPEEQKVMGDHAVMRFRKHHEER